MASPTHYEVLGVSPAASQDEIKKRFRDLARKHHPDVAPGKNSEVLFRQINSAYQILSNSEKRTLYDSELKLSALKQPRPAHTAANTPPANSDSGQKPHKSGSNASTANPSTGSRPAESTRKSSTDLLVERAHAAMRKMRYREAEMLCRQALRTDRRNMAAYEILGDIHRARGRTDEAIAMYSYVLQLDRSNSSVREKFDKLVGKPSGPTMAGNAASSAKRNAFKSSQSRSASQGAYSQGVVTVAGLGLFIMSLMLISGMRAGGVSSFMPFEWDGRAIAALILAGGSMGAVLSVNRVLGRFRTELAAAPRHGGATTPLPVGIVLIGFGLACFYLSLFAYAVISITQRVGSKSIWLAYAATLAIVASFSAIVPSGALYLVAVSGNLVFISFMAGWLFGDLLAWG
jgi:curved DNA-binding protein CbpA